MESYQVYITGKWTKQTDGQTNTYYILSLQNIIHTYTQTHAQNSKYIRNLKLVSPGIRNSNILLITPNKNTVNFSGFVQPCIVMGRKMVPVTHHYYEPCMLYSQTDGQANRQIDRHAYYGNMLYSLMVLLPFRNPLKNS